MYEYIKERFIITLVFKPWFSSNSFLRSSPNTADFDCWRLPLQSWFLWLDQIAQKQSLEHRLAIVCRMQMIPRLALSLSSGAQWGWRFSWTGRMVRRTRSIMMKPYRPATFVRLTDRKWFWLQFWKGFGKRNLIWHIWAAHRLSCSFHTI